MLVDKVSGHYSWPSHGCQGAERRDCPCFTIVVPCIWAGLGTWRETPRNLKGFAFLFIQAADVGHQPRCTLTLRACGILFVITYLFDSLPIQMRNDTIDSLPPELLLEIFDAATLDKALLDYSSS